MKRWLTSFSMLVSVLNFAMQKPALAPELDFPSNRGVPSYRVGAGTF